MVKYRKAIYVFELKRDGTADEALAQIREKGYAKPYLADGRPVYLIGLAFDSKTRQLVDAAVEELKVEMRKRILRAVAAVSELARSVRHLAPQPQQLDRIRASRRQNVLYYTQFRW